MGDKNCYDFQNSFALERRTVQPLLDLGQKPRVECLGLEPAQLQATYVAHTHKHTSFHPLVDNHERCAIWQDGRDDRLRISVVPSGLTHQRPAAFPAINRWAIFDRPYGIL